MPNNYILLGIFTVSISWNIAAICVRTKPVVVVEAALLTLSVTLAITFYAMTTDKDFTIYGPILMIVGFVFCTAGFLMAVFGIHRNLFMCIGGVLLFSFYLLFDT